MTVTVTTNSGFVYSKKDIPPRPFGENDQYISFWMDEKNNVILPMKEVKKIVFRFE